MKDKNGVHLDNKYLKLRKRRREKSTNDERDVTEWRINSGSQCILFAYPIKYGDLNVAVHPQRKLEHARLV